MENSKSICLVSPQYLPHVGGVENYVLNLSKELVAKGHKVTIVTSEYGGAPEYEKDGDVEVYRLPSYSFMKGRFPVLKKNGKTRKIKKELMQKHFDFMLINTRFYFLSLWAVKLAKKMGVRVMILDHGSAHINTGNPIASKIGEVYEHWITWREKKYCKEFAGVSRAVLEWIEHFKIYSDTVLYNAIDVEKFISLRDNACRDFRAEYGIPKDELIISFVGRLTLEKGVHLLVKAMKRVNETRKDVHCLIAGSGYLREELEPIESENTHFVGVIPTTEVGALLAGSDILCLPSLATEGFPTVVLEGTVCGNYVITTSGGGAKELVTDKEYGIVLYEINEDTLYEAIMSVLDDKEYRERATALCYDRVINNYTWKHTAENLLKIIEK